MSTSDSNCNVGASKSSNNVCEANDLLQKSTADNISLCANCGKEGDDVNNTCNKCKQVKYCNAACKKKHRHKHKKECEEYQRLAAKHAAELHDEKLFKQPPPNHGDCPICFIRIPNLKTGSRYQTCCGKEICSGCVYAPLYDNQGNEVDNKKCPFCRTPTPKSTDDANEREKKRVEKDDPMAIFNMGCYYDKGTNGYPQDYDKSLELFHRAAELGHAGACASIGWAYKYGRGVEVDDEKALHYYELAAMRGDVPARYNLGNNEARAGNIDRALRHYMIAIRSGNPNSLESIKKLYSKGYAAKGDYTKALQAYQEYFGEIKSPQRDKAAAAREDYRYF